MTKFSIQAAHEQVNPLELLDDVLVMESNGIDKAQGTHPSVHSRSRPTVGQTSRRTG